MKLEELHPKLRRPYKEGQDCGVFKSRDSKFPNIKFVIPPPPPEEAPSNLSYKLVSEALSVLRRLPSYDEMDELDKLINYLFVRREAVQSSRLEGTWSTIDEVLVGSDLADESNEQAASVRGYAVALEKFYEEAWKKKEKVFTAKVLRSIHEAIMKKDSRYMGVPGKLRFPGSPGSIVLIGGLHRPEDSIYNPAPPEFVKSCLDKVVSWLSDRSLAEKGDAGAGLTLPVRMAIGHSHFEAVHPFTDGNGRVGRALWPLQMICAGLMPLYLSGFVEVEKEAYGKALQAAQKKLDYGKIIEFFSKAIISSSNEMEVTKQHLLSLTKIWQKRGGFRKKSAADRALHVMTRSPIFTMQTLQGLLSCSTQAAANAIQLLMEKKIIRERTGKLRNRVFAAEEVIVLLSRDHGSDADLALQKGRRILGLE